MDRVQADHSPGGSGAGRPVPVDRRAADPTDAAPAGRAGVARERRTLPPHGGYGSGPGVAGRPRQSVRLRQSTLARVHRANAGAGAGQRLGGHHLPGGPGALPAHVRRRPRGARAIPHGVPAPPGRRGVQVGARHRPAEIRVGRQFRRLHRHVPRHHGAQGFGRRAARKPAALQPGQRRGRRRCLGLGPRHPRGLRGPHAQIHIGVRALGESRFARRTGDPGSTRTTCRW